MLLQSPYQTFKRYRSLQTHRISSLPIAILMPHSACNCRCVMCDIWKGNQDLKQLTEADVEGLMHTLKKLGTRQVLMSGGEALLNKNFFRFCAIIKEAGIRISLLSTGLTLAKHAGELVKWVDDIIVSLDGNEVLHDRIRNIPGAFAKMAEGIRALQQLKPAFKITARSVIHRLNYNAWPEIIEAAQQLGVSRISFLPADVSSHAFNRQQAWDNPRQHEILPAEEELEDLKAATTYLFTNFKKEFDTRFIAESREKIQDIYYYYAAFYGRNDFPFKKCNAPWVSTVIEADGTVRPCFFHDAIGTIHTAGLEEIINSDKAIAFRKQLDMANNETCRKCVCYLNLSPGTTL
ncbi:MAG TPA: radical SAM protein [Ferruginibacter sp.]|nr:radical SAM protein [Ferruginibacter sp.]